MFLVAEAECVSPRFVYGDGVIFRFWIDALEPTRGNGVIFGFWIDALKPTRGDGVDAVAFATGGVDAVASATDGVDQ